MPTPENDKNNTPNICSMKLLEGVIIIAAMLVPFVAIKSHDMTTYLYWTAVAAAYLIYITIKRW